MATKKPDRDALEAEVSHLRAQVKALKRQVSEKNTMIGALQAILKGSPSDEPPTAEVLLAAFRHLGKLLERGKDGEWHQDNQVGKAFTALCIRMAEFIGGPDWVVSAARLSQPPVFKDEVWFHWLADAAVMNQPFVPKPEDPRTDLVDTAHAFIDSIGTRDVAHRGRSLLALTLRVVYDGLNGTHLTRSGASFGCPEMSIRGPNDPAPQPPSAPRRSEGDKGPGA